MRLTGHLMREYPREIEADLLEHWNIDVLDYYRKELSFRRLGVLLIRLLSMSNRSALAMRIDAKAEWSVTDYLMAEMIDRLELSNWLAVEINSEKNPIPIPEPMHRPGHKEVIKEREFASPDELANLFAA